MFRIGVDQRSDEEARLAVEGDLDVHTSPQLRDALAALIESGVRYFVVDLNQVGYLDSTGLGALVRSMQQVRRVDGRLKIVCGSAKIRRIFDIAGLGRVLDVVSDEGAGAEGALPAQDP